MAWRGNNALPHTHGMDVISRHYIETQGLNFVDTRGIMEYFKADIATGLCGLMPPSVMLDCMIHVVQQDACSARPGLSSEATGLRSPS